jgi:small subunit ribosomal protein S17
MRNVRKVREGIVLSNKMQKTLTVRVQSTGCHKSLGKTVVRAKKYYAHVEDEKRFSIGQLVRIEETRPLSKQKRWRVLEMIESS